MLIRESKTQVHHSSVLNSLVWHKLVWHKLVWHKHYKQVTTVELSSSSHEQFTTHISCIPYWQSSEYADYISCRGVRPPQRVSLCMTLNCIQWGNKRSMEYPVIAITPRSILTRVVLPVRVLYMGQIDIFANYWYLIRILDVM